ncbi:hypothetical protein F2P81_009463 [Scophthalmus maximus]|uniref:Uncharacterized protein n=1 Tax=Scophthalmus maximus TaxID=52904 RepID=A0A6A4T1V6_SCOMX|nr:hypothetical protein F2P81_009463 [Scophthalmus maximus]
MTLQVGGRYAPAGALHGDAVTTAAPSPPASASSAPPGARTQRQGQVTGLGHKPHTFSSRKEGRKKGRKEDRPLGKHEHRVRTDSLAGAHLPLTPSASSSAAEFEFKYGRHAVSSLSWDQADEVKHFAPVFDKFNDRAHCYKFILYFFSYLSPSFRRHFKKQNKLVYRGECGVIESRVFTVDGFTWLDLQALLINRRHRPVSLDAKKLNSPDQQ